MTEFIIYLTSVLGLSMLITTSKLLKRGREYLSKKGEYVGYFLSCNQCVCIYAGIFVFLLQMFELKIILYVLSASAVGKTYDILKTK